MGKIKIHWNLYYIIRRKIGSGKHNWPKPLIRN